MDIYAAKGGLKKLMRMYNKDEIGRLFIDELKKNNQLYSYQHNSTLSSSFNNINEESKAEITILSAEKECLVTNSKTKSIVVDDNTEVPVHMQNNSLLSSSSNNINEVSKIEEIVLSDEKEREVTTNIRNSIDGEEYTEVHISLQHDPEQQPNLFNSQEIDDTNLSVNLEGNVDDNRNPVDNENRDLLNISFTQEVCQKTNNSSSSPGIFIHENNFIEHPTNEDVFYRPNADQINADQFKFQENQDNVDFSKLYERIYQLEKKCTSNDQYSRRNSLEISGIPDSVHINQLEFKVIEILNQLNIKVNLWDIEACHRLYNKPNSKSPAKVIVRFMNRKNTFISLQRKKSLKYITLQSIGINSNNKLFINENLCPAYRDIFDFAYKLLNQNVISHLWTYTGVVQLRTRDNNSKILKFTHIDDIKKYFCNY